MFMLSCRLVFVAAPWFFCESLAEIDSKDPCLCFDCCMPCGLLYVCLLFLGSAKYGCLFVVFDQHKDFGPFGPVAVSLLHLWKMSASKFLSSRKTDWGEIQASYPMNDNAGGNLLQGALHEFDPAASACEKHFAPCTLKEWICAM